MARREKPKDKAAYFLVDLSKLEAEDRDDIIQDAQMGGGEYGVVVVEEIYNGPAIQPVYGVYYGEAEQRWNDAGFAAPTVDSVDGPRADDVQTAEQLREAEEQRLRDAASATAEADARALNAQEEAELDAVTKSGNKAKNR